MKTKQNNYIILFLLIFGYSNSQTTDFDRGLQVGSILIQGLTALKGAKKTVDPNSKTVESLCIKNKLEQKIQVNFTTKIEGDVLKKDLVIQSSTKECLYQLPKGIWTFEVVLPTKEVYKKGEFEVKEETLITIDN